MSTHETTPRNDDEVELPDEEAPAHRDEDPEVPVVADPDPEGVVDDPTPTADDEVAHDPRLAE